MTIAVYQIVQFLDNHWELELRNTNIHTLYSTILAAQINTPPKKSCYFLLFCKARSKFRFCLNLLICLCPFLSHFSRGNHVLLSCIWKLWHPHVKRVLFSSPQVLPHHYTKISKEVRWWRQKFSICNSWVYFNRPGSLNQESRIKYFGMKKMSRPHPEKYNPILKVTPHPELKIQAWKIIKNLLTPTLISGEGKKL